MNKAWGGRGFLGWIPLIYLFVGSPIYALDPSVRWARQSVHSELQWLTNGADWLLGGSRADDVRNQSTLRLHGEYSIAEQHEPTHAFHIQLVTKIAALERWQQHFNEQLEAEEAKIARSIHVGTSSKGESQDPRRLSIEHTHTPAKSAEVRYSPWHFSLDKRVRFVHPKSLDAHVKARLRRDFETTQWLISGATELVWTAQEQWAAGFFVDGTSHLGAAWLLSIANTIRLDFSDKAITTVHGPALNKVLSEHQALSIGVSVETGYLREDRHWRVSGYSIPMTYRLELAAKGLFLAVSPGIYFSRAQNFRGDALVNFALQLIF